MERKFTLDGWRDREYVTRNGRPALVVWDGMGGKFPLLCVFQNADGWWSSFTCMADGRSGALGDSNFDLFDEPVKRRVWVNVFKSTCPGRFMVTGPVFASEREAAEHAKCVPLEYLGTITGEVEG